MRRRHARCRAGTTAPLHAGAEAQARFCTMAQSDLMLPRARSMRPQQWGNR